MNDNAEKWVIPEALRRDLLVLLRLNDWPVTSEDSLAARDRLVRWVESVEGEN
jgi:hypothetical protein